MSGLGFSISIKAGRPRVVAVRASGPADGVSYDVVFEHWSSQAEDDSQRLSNLAAAVATLLTTERAAAVVIRRMDWNGQQKREVVAKRGQAEGVVAATVRGRITLCRMSSGHEVAEVCGSTKKMLEEECAPILGSDFKEAVAASRAALVLAERH
jgi:hypothetical protein